MSITINESYTAKGWTPGYLSAAVFAGYARTIKSITIHHWGVFGQIHQDVVNFFCSTGPGATSAHFVASGFPVPRVDCIVSPLDVAWHAGNAYGNATSVGIECRPEATLADYKVVAELVAWIRSEYGADLPLVPHRDWQATLCPGIWDLARIDTMARAIVGAGAVTKPDVTPVIPKPTTPSKDGFDMADLDDLRQVLREYNPWAYKNPKLEKDDAYAILRANRDFAVKGAADAAATRATVESLVGAIKALSAGEKFDEAKLLNSIEERSAAGVKSAIESIETMTTVRITAPAEQTGEVK